MLAPSIDLVYANEIGYIFSRMYVERKNKVEEFLSLYGRPHLALRPFFQN